MFNGNSLNISYLSSIYLSIYYYCFFFQKFQDVDINYEIKLLINPKFDVDDFFWFYSYLNNLLEGFSQQQVFSYLNNINIDNIMMVKYKKDRENYD